MGHPKKPIVLITGAAGDIGTALASALERDYTVVGFDLPGMTAACDCIGIDLRSDDSVELAFRKFRDRYGRHIASVVHLAAYFDFTGEENPLYEKVNVDGTWRLLANLQRFEVEQFVYSGTMLVHAACAPGQTIDESAPIAPKWAYPMSKAEAEDVIKQDHGDIPYVLLHIAGLYDDRTAVPTLAHQIARIYERDLKSHLYPGDPCIGQSFVHKDDLIDAFRRTVDRRGKLPDELTMLIGEPEVMSYQVLQDDIGRRIHGEENWPTAELPKPIAKAGAWATNSLEPVIPDAIDKGEKPFIQPFMVDIADDHYALDIERARRLLGWEPAHNIKDTLGRIVEALKDDPLGWYRANGVTAPEWLESAADKVRNPERLRARHETHYRDQHRSNLWAHFLNAGLGAWLITAPASLGYQASDFAWSDVGAGLAIIFLSLLSLSWRLAWARWACAGVGIWLLFAPLVFWVPSAAAYLNDTLVAALVIGFAVLTRPAPGISVAAAEAGPTVPKGWDFTPSSWFQRLPIIILAVVGFFIARYLAAYQLGHIQGVWEPFFAGGLDPKNGTEEIITSRVSDAWPISDAGVGALTYMLEILTGIMGSARRWRTMPWLVVLFGIMIVPLGVVSITFIVIQPIMIGTWCTLCLIAAAAMLLQIPYSLDELVATAQFLRRRRKAGRNLFRVFFLGDTDEGAGGTPDDNFERSPARVVKDVIGGGVSLPWNLAVCLAIGVWLMFTRLTIGAHGDMANADHLMGSLVVTVTVAGLAEVARPLRFLNMGFGFALCVLPFVLGADWRGILSGLVCGIVLFAFSIRRGPIERDYGSWNRYMV